LRKGIGKGDLALMPRKATGYQRLNVGGDLKSVVIESGRCNHQQAAKDDNRPTITGRKLNNVNDNSVQHVWP
jgi:hypothetical protein